MNPFLLSRPLYSPSPVPPTPFVFFVSCSYFRNWRPVGGTSCDDLTSDPLGTLLASGNGVGPTIKEVQTPVCIESETINSLLLHLVQKKIVDET